MTNPARSFLAVSDKQSLSNCEEIGILGMPKKGFRCHCCARKAPCQLLRKVCCLSPSLFNAICTRSHPNNVTELHRLLQGWSPLGKHALEGSYEGCLALAKQISSGLDAPTQAVQDLDKMAMSKAAAIFPGH